MRPEDTIPYGYCQCGCGRKTRLATLNRPKWGHVRGQPVRYLPGHHTRRFWLDAYAVNENGCWIWQGSRSDSGYAVFLLDGIQHYVHRLFYERKFGPLPEGWVADHRCPGGPVRRCVNPDHMRPLPFNENARQRVTNKIDWEQAGQIRALAPTMKQRDIAKLFGISQSSVWRVIHCITWHDKS